MKPDTRVEHNPFRATLAHLSEPRYTSSPIASLRVWEQGSFGTRNRNAQVHHHCLLGGLLCTQDSWLMMGNRGSVLSQLIDILRDVLHEQYRRWVSIEEWNDTPGRTFEEITMVLEKAAVRWEETHA